MHDAPSTPRRAFPAVRIALIFFVLSFAFSQFSENTADVDLWGQVLIGRATIASGHLPAGDVYSWTVAGRPGINHEYGAGIVLAALHRLAGGPGIFWFMLAMASVTFLLALRTGLREMPPAWRPVGWLLAFVAAGEIAFGFSARAQMFTGLFLAVTVAVLAAWQQGRRGAIWILPPLFALWINLHGGVLAGLVVVGAACAASWAQSLFRQRRLERRHLELAGAVLLCALALLLNPWGFRLIVWLVKGVAWLRPEIDEWNPAGLGFEHLAFFATAGIAVLALAFSRRPRLLWEWAVLGFLGLAAFRSVRHAPLFCIAALALVTPHVADVCERMMARAPGLRKLAARPGVASIATLLLFGAGVVQPVLVLSQRGHPFTMDVDRSQFPVSAIRFIRDAGIEGRMISFFDWGELCMWELPSSRVSFDGRLDTAYPREVADAHWSFYRGEPFDAAVLDVDRADYALLPAGLAGSVALSRKPGWTLVYLDPLAVVIVRDAARFKKLRALKLPARAGDEALAGSEPFPDSMPVKI